MYRKGRRRKALSEGISAQWVLSSSLNLNFGRRNEVHGHGFED